MKNHHHIPKEIQFLAIEEESEIQNQRPDDFLPVPPSHLVVTRSDSYYGRFCGQGGLL